jgi:hypothetical protein
MRALTTTFADPQFVTEETAETDEYACLDCNDCADPGGHLFLTSCGETKCVHCGKVAWS